ncbi:unnamed protein product [Onchocerca ochengi]|uniref:Phospholipase-like protein n=1 Tax=Onchocerca ochengi TaxID=42157 RepID=A0A182EBT9_ONCOC|nr:unnamed protein product [Onchocerca ochengi]
MHRSDKNRYASEAQTSSKQMVLRPKILARRVRKKSSNTSSNTESATLHSESYSTEKKEFETSKIDEASRTEAIFGCAALGEILRKKQPVLVTEPIPVFRDCQLRMRFGDEEDISDRVHMIGFALAEHALKAFRTFTFPKEAAKVNLNSTDDSANISQILSDSHLVEQDNSSYLTFRKLINIRIEKTKLNDWEASTSEHTVHQHMEFQTDEGRSDIIMHEKKTKAYDFPSTSDDYGDSIERGEDGFATIEDLNSEEKALIDQAYFHIKSLLTNMNGSSNPNIKILKLISWEYCADASWYSKLKMAIFLRLQQLVENMKNAVIRRRELRERNEELCKLRQHLIERNRINESEYACEEKRREDDVATIEDLNSEEKALVDQVLLLCSQFIRGINCADASWYSKLKMAIFLRLQQLVENMKNAVTRRRELRERNEELCKLHQHLIERNRINESECACEEILDDEIMCLKDDRSGREKRNDYSCFNRTDQKIMET